VCGHRGRAYAWRGSSSRGRAAGLSTCRLTPPDFNPIEQAFSKIKGLLHRTEARTHQSLIEAMGRALEAVSAQDARGFFAHCGYCSMDQLL
jgi:hypothetical protein